MQNMIQARNVRRCFRVSGNDFWALKGVDMDVPAGALTILQRPLRLGQDHADEHPRRAWTRPPSGQRAVRRARTSSRWTNTCPDEAAPGAHRLRVPVRGADSHDDRAVKTWNTRLRLARIQGRPPGARAGMPAVWWASASAAEAHASGAVRRRAAARGHRPRHRPSPAGDLRRRAHRPSWTPMTGLQVVKIFKDLTAQRGRDHRHDHPRRGTDGDRRSRSTSWRAGRWFRMAE